MQSFFKGWAKKTLSKEPKRKPAITGGWFGIVTQFGNLSEVKSSRTMAGVALSNRGDRDVCKIVPIIISFPPEAEEKEHLQPKPKRARKKRR